MRVWSVVRTRMDARAVYVRGSEGCERVSFTFHTSEARRATGRGTMLPGEKEDIKEDATSTCVAVENRKCRAQNFPNPRRRFAHLNAAAWN